MPPASRASARVGTASASSSRWLNSSNDTLIPWAVAHSSNSARLNRYCPATYRAGSPRWRIQRVIVASETSRTLLTSRTVNCIATPLLLDTRRSWLVDLVQHLLHFPAAATTGQLQQQTLVLAHRGDLAKDLETV